MAATIPSALTEFATGTIAVGQARWFVAVADTPELRFQGLRRVADLGALDGMLFVWDAELDGASTIGTVFTMRTVPIPLDIGFFDSTGVLFDVVNMFPCGDSDDCPLYGASGPFEFAVERPAGGWDDIELGVALVREN